MIVGKGIDRIDARLKVMGAAEYATDYKIANPAHAFVIKSEIAAGNIVEIDAGAAEKSEGVLAVITHKNAVKLNTNTQTQDRNSKPVPVLHSTKIEYYGQNIGVVVAETYEQARYAAGLIKVTYDKTPAKTDFDKHAPEAYAPKNINANNKTDTLRGDVETAFRDAEFKIEAEYETPIEHHQPIETHSTLAVWTGGDKLTLYNGSQNVISGAGVVAATFNLPKENVRMISPHIGGGFGSKGTTWTHVILAAMAAQAVKRPVKLALTRQQMFTSVGLRQRNRQKVRLAASKDGKLTALAHEIVTHTAIETEFVEQTGAMSRIMYEVPNSLVTHRVVKMNLHVPTYVRAPGETPGSFALESAMDELAHRLKIDPVEFRLRNEPKIDPETQKPWSSRAVVASLKRGAEMFDWKRRKSEPRQVSSGNYFIGYGVACGTYPARQQPASAQIKLTKNGAKVMAEIGLAATDLGTGTHTIVAQIAADALELPVEQIAVKIGDSVLPPTPGSGGSWGAATFSNVVFKVCEAAKTELYAKAGVDWFAPPTVAQLMDAVKITEYQTKADAKQGEEAKKYSIHTFNANFVEVWVEKTVGTIKIPRIVSVTGAGKILNAKTARSQIIGGNVWGISQALHEESPVDPRWGNFVARGLADYHVPTNLDVGTIEVDFIAEDDRIVNDLGVKGLGEIGIVGMAAAIANAIFNATGKRIRHLPITPDKLI